MELANRIAGISTNLDDLQSGVEACSRAVDALHETLKQIKEPPLRDSLVHHHANLQACARDQRDALRELREGVARLLQELKRPTGAVRPPPVDIAADTRQR